MISSLRVSAGQTMPTTVTGTFITSNDQAPSRGQVQARPGLQEQQLTTHGTRARPSGAAVGPPAGGAVHRAVRYSSLAMTERCTSVAPS